MFLGADENSLLLWAGLNNGLVPRGAPDHLTRPPSFDPEIYTSVPIFNRRVDLLALVASFLVIIIRLASVVRLTEVEIQAFSWVCCVWRFCIRFIARTPGWDDFFLVLALVCCNSCSTSLARLTRVQVSTTVGSIFLCIGVPIMTLLPGHLILG